MTSKEFYRAVVRDKEDILQQFLDLLHQNEIDYCVIGGLAVNAYVEPVVSLDLHVVIVTSQISKLLSLVESSFKVVEFEHSLNLSRFGSDLRIQIQTDPNYQNFLTNTEIRNVLDYQMKVASIENILQGKLWAYSDETRRRSKRQKDLTDIFRIVEAFPKLENLLPEILKRQIK